MENIPERNERQMHPTSIAVLVFGIASVPFSYFGVYLIAEFIAFTLGLISLLLSLRVSKAIHTDPRRYSAPARGLNKAGRICAIIGIAVSIIHTFIWFYKYY